MGERCSMTIRCRREHAARFETLGFSEEFEAEDKNTPAVTLVDHEANWAHSGEMPTDVPWTGTSDACYSYGASRYACDGKDFAEVDAGHGGEDFVVQVVNGNIEKTCRDRIIQYERVLKRAEKLLKKGTK